MTPEENTAEILEDINTNVKRIAKAAETLAWAIVALSSGLLAWIGITVFRQ